MSKSCPRLLCSKSHIKGAVFRKEIAEMRRRFIRDSSLTNHYHKGHELHGQLPHVTPESRSRMWGTTARANLGPNPFVPLRVLPGEPYCLTAIFVRVYSPASSQLHNGIERILSCDANRCRQKLAALAGAGAHTWARTHARPQVSGAFWRHRAGLPGDAN